MTSQAGTTGECTDHADDLIEIKRANGVKSTRRPATDARFGLQTTLFSRTVSTPNGLSLERAEKSEIEPAAPDGPFDYDTLTTTVTIEDDPTDRVFTREFDQASLTFTDTTPAGRTREQEVDTQGRVVREQ